MFRVLHVFGGTNGFNLMDIMIAIARGTAVEGITLPCAVHVCIPSNVYFRAHPILTVVLGALGTTCCVAASAENNSCRIFSKVPMRPDTLASTLAFLPVARPCSEVPLSTGTMRHGARSEKYFGALEMQLTGKYVSRDGSTSPATLIARSTQCRKRSEKNCQLCTEESRQTKAIKVRRSTATLARLVRRW